MRILQLIRDNLIHVLISFLIIHEESLRGVAVSTESVNGTLCQDGCGKSSVNFLNELRLDLKFANDLINDSKASHLIEEKIHELDMATVEHELGIERIESSWMNTTISLLNMFQNGNRIAGCEEGELPQMFACLTETFDRSLIALKKKLDQSLEHESMRTKYREAYSNFDSKLYALQSLIQDFIDFTGESRSNSFLIDCNQQIVFQSLPAASSNSNFDNIEDFFNEQIKCGQSIRADISEAETIKEQLIRNRIETENAKLMKLQKLKDSMSQAVSDEQLIYDKVRYATELIGSELLNFSPGDGEHVGVIEVGELMGENKLVDTVKGLLGESLESVNRAQVMVNQTERLIHSLKIEELIKDLVKKIDTAKLMLDRML